MTQIPTTEEFWGVDSFLAFSFPLNSDGSLQVPGLEPYEGLEIDGTRNFNLTPAAGTVVANVGNGRLRDTIYRAPREPSRAEFTIGYTQQELKAKLSGVNTYTIGEMRGLARLTDRQGSEPDTGFLVVQRGHNENGLTRYRTYMIPKSRIIPRDSPLNENASEETFEITISNTKKMLWGKPFAIPVHGHKDAGYEEYVSEGCPKVVAWLADDTEVEYFLPEDFPAISETKMAVFNFNTGLEYITGITKEVDRIEFGYPPDDLIVAVYEYEP